MGKKNKIKPNSQEFFDNLYYNDATYCDYLDRLKKVATSIFEWVNLPESMNQRCIEEYLFYYGMCALLKDGDYGFINTKCTSDGNLNIYGLPTSLNCFSYSYHKSMKLYTGLPFDSDNDNTCILVMNNWDRIATINTIQLFAYRLYEAETTAMTNIKAQKTPILLTIDETQRLTMENIYSQYDGNKPVIFGDKKQLADGMIKAIKTDAPFIADKVMDYKKEIWNEALTYLGVNNIMINKKERLITDEANSNNELINLNLQSFLIPRQEACREFNKKYGLEGSDKEISVRVRSDLLNVIKHELSITKDFDYEENKEKEEVVENG